MSRTAVYPAEVVGALRLIMPVELNWSSSVASLESRPTQPYSVNESVFLSCALA